MTWISLNKNDEGHIESDINWVIIKFKIFKLIIKESKFECDKPYI